MEKIEINKEVLEKLPKQALIDIALVQEKIIKTQEELVNELKFVHILQENAISELKELFTKGGRL